MMTFKYERFLGELDGCVEQVETAIKNGAMLTEMEKMDYYFKRILSTDEEPGIIKEVFGETAYRLANFYASVINDIQDIKVEGYTNSDVYDTLKSICVYARLTRLSSTMYSVHVYDYNGTLYVDFYRGSKREDTMSIRCKKDFIKVIIAMATFLATDSPMDWELKNFAAGYLVNVYNEIASLQSPKPYIYKGLAKTLNNYIVEENKEAKPVNKVVNFRIG